MDDRRLDSQNSLLETKTNEQRKSCDEKLIDTKKPLAGSLSSKDSVDKLALNVRQPFLPAKPSYKKDDEKLPVVSSNLTSSPQPALTEKGATTEPSPECSKVDNKKQNAIRRGRFFGDRSRGAIYSKTVSPTLVESRFPSDFNFDDLEYMPNQPESPHDSPKLLSSILDDIPEPDFEAICLPEALAKTDLDSEPPITYSTFEQSPASPDVSSTFLSYDENTSKELPHGYLFTLNPPYFDESKTLNLLEEPLREIL